MPFSFKKPIYLLLFLSSVAISIIGIYKNQAIFTTSWVNESSKRNLIIFTFGYFALSFLGCLIWRKKILQIILFAIAVFSLFVLGFSNFLVPVVVFIASIHFGYFILESQQLRNIKSSLEVSLLIGLSFFSFTIYLLSLTPYNSVQTYSILLLLPFLLKSKNILSNFHEFGINLKKFLDFTTKEVIITVLIFWGVLIHLHQTFRPEFGFDALAAHLMIPHFIKANGFWSFNFSQFVFGANQLGADMLYAFCYMLSGEEGTRFFNFLMFLMVVKLTYEVCRIFADRFVSLISILSLILTPLLFTQTTSLHIECVWVAFILGANLICLQLMSAKEITKELFFNASILLAVILGTALAIKLPTLFYLPFIFFALALLLWRRGFKNSEVVKGMALPITIFFIFGLLPYLYCYYLTGNPVFPYFNGVFKSDYFYKSLSFNNPIFNKPLSYRTLYDMTFHGSWYLESLDYPISLTYLMFFAPIVYFVVSGLRNLKIVLISSQVFFAGIGIYIFQSYFRYILPSLVLYVVLIAALIEFFRVNQRFCYQSSIFGIFLILPISVIHIPDPTISYKEFNWEKAITRKLEVDRLFGRPQQVVFDYLNTRYDNRAVVFHIQQPLTAGLDALSLVPVWYNPELARRVNLFTSIADIKTLVKTYGITHFLSNSNDLKLQYSNDVSNQYFIDFLATSTEIEMEYSNMTLYKVDFTKIPEANLIGVGDIKANVASVDLKGARNVLLTQNFDFIPSELRDFGIVLNWLDVNGTSLDIRYINERVSKQATFFDYHLEVPEDAVTLIISLPTIDSKDEDNYKIQLMKIGDQSMIAHFRGD